MKMFEGMGLALRWRKPRFLIADSAFLVSKTAIFRFSSTPFLRSEQASSDHVQIGERRGHFQSVQVLGQAAVAGLAEAEDIFDHTEHVLHLGAHARLVAV